MIIIRVCYKAFLAVVRAIAVVIAVVFKGQGGVDLTVNRRVARFELVFFDDAFPAVDDRQNNHVGAFDWTDFSNGSDGGKLAHLVLWGLYEKHHLGIRHLAIGDVHILTKIRLRSR